MTPNFVNTGLGMRYLHIFVEKIVALLDDVSENFSEVGIRK